MGFLKDSAADRLTSDAARAYAEGRYVFTAKLNSRDQALSGSISGWAEMIEAIEAAGWALTEWSVATDEKGHPEAYPFFRRRT